MASDGKSAAGVLGVPLCVRSHCILLFRKLVGNTPSERCAALEFTPVRGFTLFTWSGSSATALSGIAPHIALVFRHSLQGKGSCVLHWSGNLQHSCMWFYSLPRSIDSLLLVSSSNFWFLSLFILLSSHADLKKIFSLTHDRFFCFHLSVPLEDWNFIWFQAFRWCHSLWSPYLMTLHRLLIWWSHVIFTCTHITCHAMVGLLTDLHVSCLWQLVHPSLPPYWLSWLCEDNIGPTVRVSMDEPATETSECYSWLC